MFNLRPNARVLLLSPHTDDVEICCGGTVARLVRAGCELRYIAFSDCQESVPEGFPKDVLNIEARESTAVLGVPSEHVDILRFPVRHFGRHRQDILEHLIKVRSEFKPDAVLCPSQFDVHQDHKVISDEALRAYRGSSIFGYEAPWNNFSMRHDLFVELSDEDLHTKFNALKCYKSQEGRSYISEQYISSIARVRGQQAGYEFAEAFAVTRIRIDK